MELTFVNDLEEIFIIKIDPNTDSLEDVMALLEAESSIPVNEQSIYYQGRELSNPKSTIRQLNLSENSTLLLRRKVANVGGGSIEQDSEILRLQILGDPQLMVQLQEFQPGLAAAAQSNPARFAELLKQKRERHSSEMTEQPEIERSNGNPETQKKAEEAIRQRAIVKNLELALEHSPESFARVPMPFVNVEVNSYRTKALVFSGANQTIMSHDTAKASGLMPLLDTRFSGVARGVGTANILGRIHSAQMKLADLSLPCAFSIVEGYDFEILLGLDMLTTHQACIDLDKGVLRIKGRELRFLSEHELSDRARDALEHPPETISTSPSAPTPQTPSTPAPAAFPSPERTSPLEQSIEMLMSLGFTRESVVSALESAGGNVDVAASLLF